MTPRPEIKAHAEARAKYSHAREPSADTGMVELEPVVASILAAADADIETWLEGVPVRPTDLGRPPGTILGPLSAAGIGFMECWLNVPRALDDGSLVVGFELATVMDTAAELPITIARPDLVGTSRESDLIERAVERAVYLDCEALFHDEGTVFRVDAVHVSDAYPSAGECRWKDQQRWHFRDLDRFFDEDDSTEQSAPAD